MSRKVAPLQISRRGFALLALIAKCGNPYEDVGERQTKIRRRIANDLARLRAQRLIGQAGLYHLTAKGRDVLAIREKTAGQIEVAFQRRTRRWKEAHGAER